jgi:hypothetical protein
VRLSIGLEHIDDIIADLDQGLKASAESFPFGARSVAAPWMSGTLGRSRQRLRDGVDQALETTASQAMRPVLAEGGREGFGIGGGPSGHSLAKGVRLLWTRSRRSRALRAERPNTSFHPN